MRGGGGEEEGEGKGRCASMCVCFLCGYIETGRASRREREGGDARCAVGVGMQERRALSRVWAVAGRQHRQCEGDEEAVEGRDEWEGCGDVLLLLLRWCCVCVWLCMCGTLGFGAATSPTDREWGWGG